MREAAGALADAVGVKMTGATGGLCVVPSPASLFMMRPPLTRPL
jgi:hypothetical protein